MRKKKIGMRRLLLLLGLLLMTVISSMTVCASETAGGQEDEKTAVLKFDKTVRTMSVGTKKTIRAESQGIAKVRYSSSNKKVASVNAATGKVTVKKEGTARITAKGGGLSASYTIKAKPVVKLNASSVKVSVNGKKTLKATVKGSSAKKRWKSSNPKVASVSSKGVITGKKAGTATITVYVNGIHGRVSAKCKVQVTGPKISLNKTSLTLQVKGTTTLKATVKNSKNTVKWKSSNPKVVSVSASKNKVTLKGKKAGTANITAYIGNTKAVCKVEVQETDWKTLYYDFLKKAETSFSYTSGIYTTTSHAESFYLLHLNDDSVPELVVSNMPVNSIAPINYWVYTIENEKVTLAGIFGQKSRGVIRYSSKYRAIHTDWWTNGVGGAGEALWKVKNGKWVQVKYSYSYNEGSKRIYKTGDNLDNAVKVSESQAKKFQNTYLNPKNDVDGTWLKNTESVRLKQFKS